MKKIHTPRLVLRALRINDCYDLCDILCDEQTAWWFGMSAKDSPEDLYYFINKHSWGLRQYGILEKGSKTVIGVIQVSVCRKDGSEYELGYFLSKDYRGKGYMTEVVKTVSNRLFYNPKIDVVSLRVLPSNLPSQGVARNAGFVLEPQEEWEKSISRMGYFLDRLVLTRKNHMSAKAA